MEKETAERLFISFANSQLNRKDIFGLLKEVSNYSQLKKISKIKELLDIKQIDTYKPSNPSRFREFKNFHELFFKNIYIGLHKTEQDNLAISHSKSGGELDFIHQTPALVKRRLKYLLSQKEFNRVELFPKGYEEIGVMFQFIYSLKYSQSKLKLILNKVTKNSPLDANYLQYLTKQINVVRTDKKLILGIKLYLEGKEKVLPVQDEGVYKNPYLFFKKILEPIIYYDLVNFLSEKEWVKLKQCEECKRFFKSNKNNPNQRFCRLNGNRCHDVYHSKEGKGAARLRKGREVGKYQY